METRRARRRLRGEILTYMRTNRQSRHTTYSLGFEMACSNSHVAEVFRALEEEGLITWDKGQSGVGAKLTLKGKHA